MMITYKEHPNAPEELDNLLHPLVRQWFFSQFQEFSLPQLYGVMEIHGRNNVLVSAPTGATKTLTGFLSIINELIDSAQKGILEGKVYCVYISPLKALSNDISVNLIRPLKEMEALAKKKLGIRVGVRTGDTTASQRSAMVQRPPHILITTPESLAIMLSTTKFREHLRDVAWCIVDEIHALAENKRGTHLSLSLERLQALSPYMTRVGLSATVAPLEEIARYLVGDLRPCKVIDVQFIKKLDLKVLSPVKDFMSTTQEAMHDQLYTLIDQLVQGHKTTVIFTNTRSATERVVHHLKERFPQNYTENIGAHHGSLSKRHRLDIESRLREGKLKVVVTSTSLELGIDIGYIDLVILLSSPKSVARAIQRCGRSGHRLHDVTKGRIIVLDRDDLVECAVLLKEAVERKIDRIHIPRNALDVLAQHIYGIAIADRISINDLFRLVTRSYCYQDLSRKSFNDIIDYLSGKFAPLEDRNIYAKIWYDETTGMIGRRGKFARIIYMTNIGTIPDETYVQVKVNEQIVGMIDEAFLERLKRGDVFVLGGQRYEFLFSRGMVAQVKATADRPPTIPSWFSEMLPLSFDLSMAIGRFRRLMQDQFAAKKSKEQVITFILEYLYVDEYGAHAIYEYFREQYRYAAIPHDRKVIVEQFRDNQRRYAVFHTLYGRRVNDCLSRAVAYAVGRSQHRDLEIGITDNGFYLAAEQPIAIRKAISMLHAAELRPLLEQAIERTEVLKRRFRHCATRALMILRTYKGRQKHVGRQQVSSMILMSAVKRLDPDFSILAEARREVLEDLMDVASAAGMIAAWEKGTIAVEELQTPAPSPFAFSIVLMSHTDVMKMEERLAFLQRMHRNVLAKIGETPAAPGPFDYHAVWEEAEQVQQSEEEIALQELKQMAWNVQHVPAYAKVELARMIDGHTDIREDVLAGIDQHAEEIRQGWPRKLSQFILRRRKEIG